MVGGCSRNQAILCPGGSPLISIIPRETPKSSSHPLFVDLFAGSHTNSKKPCFSPLFPPVSCWQWVWETPEEVVLWGMDGSHRAGLSPGLASSRIAEFKSQGHWKAQPTPSPTAQDTQGGHLHVPRQGRGGRSSLQRTDPVPPPSHLLHSLRPRQLSVVALLGTPVPPPAKPEGL